MRYLNIVLVNWYYKFNRLILSIVLWVFFAVYNQQLEIRIVCLHRSLISLIDPGCLSFWREVRCQYHHTFTVGWSVLNILDIFHFYKKFRWTFCLIYANLFLSFLFGENICIQCKYAIFWVKLM